MLSTFAITQQGQAHIERQVECQDASRTEIIQLPFTEVAVSAVADGVGSCMFSATGSMLAVNSAVDMVCAAIQQMEYHFDPDAILPLIKSSFDHALATINNHAETSMLSVALFDTTLTLSVYDSQSQTLWFGHIGDDGIVALYTDGTYKLVTTRHKGNEHNVVLPLRDVDSWEFCICKYKNRTDTNVVWSTSNASVAAVDSSGKVTAKGVGTCTITAKHKIFGTTATCKITVIEKVTLNTTAKEQSNSSCCSGASAFTVLKFLKGASFSKTDLQLYKEMGSTGVVYKIRDVLNKYLNKTVYKYGTYSSQSAYEKAVIKSIDAGYPVIALVKITDSKYFAYKSNGHFTTISGYRVNDDGSVDFRITDSYKISKNGGTFWIPAKVFFKYSKAHGNPYYLILKK